MASSRLGLPARRGMHLESLRTAQRGTAVVRLDMVRQADDTAEHLSDPNSFI